MAYYYPYPLSIATIMLSYNHRDLDAYNDKCVVGSGVCRVLLIWAGLGWPRLDVLIIYSQPWVPGQPCLGWVCTPVWSWLALR